MRGGDDYLLMNILKPSITSWRVRSFFPSCHLHKLGDNGSTGLHRGYKLFQIEQANMLHPCSTALIKKKSKEVTEEEENPHPDGSIVHFCDSIYIHHKLANMAVLVALVWATPKADPQRVQWGWGHSFIPKQILLVSEKPNLSASTLPPMTPPPPPPPSHCLHQRMLLNQHHSVSTFCHRIDVEGQRLATCRLFIWM